MLLVQAVDICVSGLKPTTCTTFVNLNLSTLCSFSHSHSLLFHINSGMYPLVMHPEIFPNSTFYWGKPDIAVVHCHPPEDTHMSLSWSPAHVLEWTANKQGVRDLWWPPRLFHTHTHTCDLARKLKTIHFVG